MNYGYFDEKAREYVITNPNTPAPWANYLGSPDSGAIVTVNAGGYSFVKSGAAGRILRYTFNLFYVDRITEDIDNELQIQSTGVQVLGNVLRGLPALGVFQAGDAAIRTFNQKFEDACAGAFATVTLEVGVDTVCHLDYDPLPIPII